MTIKAIETQYKGYRFRSRLEARWAVFFDALGVKWEYEKEGFDLGEAGWYLPDFWLPAQEWWIEIKPNVGGVVGDELKKAHALAEGLQQETMIVYGDPWEGSHKVFRWALDAEGIRAVIAVFYFDQCPVCDSFQAISYEMERGEEAGKAVLWCHPYRKRRCGVCEREYEGGPSSGISSAFRAARAARFEHGGTPKVDQWH